MPWDLLTVQNVSVVGFLLIACIYLARENDKSATRIIDNAKENRENAAEDKKRLISECNEMKKERTEERHEQAELFTKLTYEVGRMADQLKVVPEINKKIESLQVDINVLKGDMGTLKNEANINRMSKVSVSHE